MTPSVLVVAEEIDLHGVIVADLTEQGLIVNVASSTPEALRILHTSPVPVIAFFAYWMSDVTPLMILP